MNRGFQMRMRWDSISVRNRESLPPDRAMSTLSPSSIMEKSNRALSNFSLNFRWSFLSSFEGFVSSISFHEYEVDSTDDEQESQNVVPMKALPLKQDVGHNCEHAQADALLDDLELDKRERAAVADKAHSVGWHLTAIFKEGDAPGEDDDTHQGPSLADAGNLEAQMSVPCQRHKYIAQDEQQNRI